MRDLSLHILDIAENSIRAGAKRIEISLAENLASDLLSLEIRDDGAGMDEATRRSAARPFFTSKPNRRIGLGVALLEQATQEAEGRLEIASEPGGGTRITATFRFSHPDRKPTGNIAASLEALVAGNPGVDFRYERRSGKDLDVFDTREVGCR